MNSVTRHEAIDEAAKFVQGKAAAFRDEVEILEAVRILIGIRGVVSEPSSRTELAKAASLQKRATARFQERLALAPVSIPVIQLCERHNLTPLERELLIFLIASTLGTIPSITDVEDAQGALARGGADGLAIARALAEEGTFVNAELTKPQDSDEFVRTQITLNAGVLAGFLKVNSDAGEAWAVASQEELLDRCFPLFAKLKERAERLERRDLFFDRGDVRALTIRIERLDRAYRRTLEQHMDWPIAQATRDLLPPEHQIVTLLVGKDLGFADSDDGLFLGEGLGRAVVPDAPKLREALTLLRRNGRLRGENFIRVCGGRADGEAFDDDATLRTCEFELTDDFRERSGIKRQWRRLRTRSRLKTPTITMDQLVLPPEVMESLRMVVAQMRNRRVLLEDWGFASVLPYGRGVTALFAGSPGLGKTACAEALACELGMPLLGINYSEIQSCWVGETEKNVVRAFREATEAGAVLFWDEADAMFFDRDSAVRNWEVRDVNVLLQQIEKFEGLCILATNRKITLDKALERRLAVKIEFNRPREKDRGAIWSKLLPAKLPLAPDVDLAKLARVDLSGGEIKNVVLNAARIALSRGSSGPITMSDFSRALEMEKAGRWNTGNRRLIGFKS